MFAAVPTSDQSSSFYQCLIDGDEASCWSQIEEARVQRGVSMLQLCLDLAGAFHRIGDDWETAGLTVYQEHVASQIGCRLLWKLRNLLPVNSERRPKAIGCSPECDPYDLPTLMVEIALCDLGWNAESLGTNLPLEMLAPAIESFRPNLCWVSVSHVDSVERVCEQLNHLGRLGLSQNVEVICGGRALNREILTLVENVTFLTDLGDLTQFAAEAE